MKLTKRIEIYVPEIPGHEHEYQEAMRILAGLCGGSTETRAQGAWIDDSGNIINDNIHLVYAYYNRLSFAGIREILDYVHYMKQELKQELVSVTFAGALHLI